MTTKSTLLTAVRAKCLDCAQSRSAVRKCHSTACTLHPYRMGKDPAPSKTVGFGKRTAVAVVSERHDIAALATAPSTVPAGNKANE